MKNQDKILVTKNYGTFKFANENRKIDPNHVERLKHSLNMFDDLHLNPIIVNSNMEVVDGQHRLKAASELEKPIYYQIDDNYNSMKMVYLNATQKTWSIEDYVNFWESQNCSEYKKLREYQKETGFLLSTTLYWLKGESSDYLNKLIKSGKFVFQLSESVIKGVYSMKKLIALLQKENFRTKSIYRSKAFHLAGKKLFTNPNVDHERFFERLEKYPNLFKYCTSVDSYIEQFVNIYNFNQKKGKLKLLKNGRTTEIVI